MASTSGEISDAVTIGRRLVELREGRGLTQEDIADVIGRSRSTVYAAEAGRRVRPKTLRLMAEALGTTLEGLLGESWPPDDRQSGMSGRYHYEGEVAPGLVITIKSPV